MACLIALIDPTKEKTIKSITLDENYLNSEKRVIELNEALNKKLNPKELYWKVIAINV